MTILVVGATGATGKLLVKELLNRGHKLKVIVRSAETLVNFLENHKDLTIIEGGILELSDEEINKLLDERSRLARNLPVDPDDILSNPDLTD